MGNMTWKHPDYFTAFDPTSGTVCNIENVKDNKGFFLGEYDIGIKTVFPEIERWFLALGEATPYTRRPNTVTPALAPSSYQDLVAYNAHCSSPDNDTSYVWGQTSFAEAVAEEVQSYQNIGGGDFVGYQTGIEPI
jgi:hypothetical protein